MSRQAAQRSTRTGRSAEPRRSRLLERLAAWRDLHLYSFVSSVGRLAQKPWGTVLTVGVIAIALALPLCLALLLRNVESVSGGFRDVREFSLFLRPGLAPEQVERAREDLIRLPEVARVDLRSPEQGLAEFAEMSDLAGSLSLLDYNPLPAVLVVEPRGGDPVPLAAQLAGLPEVDFVQHDAEWRARLEAWLGFGRQATWLVASLLGIGVLLVVGNTVRLDIQSRAEEIETLQLLGATDGFVRRPFLYLGACYGALAGLTAIAIAVAMRTALEVPVKVLVASYGSDFALTGMRIGEAAAVLVFAVALGWLGAWAAAGHHLRQSLPGVRR